MEVLNLRRLKDSVPFSETLNQFVSDKFTELGARGINFTFVEGQPYDSYEEMKAEFQRTGGIAISKDFSDKTIFGNKGINWCFRAVHDMQHLTLDLGFSPEHEFIITYKMLQEYRKAGLSQLDIDLLTIEMNGQVAYFVENGKFPECQRTFTMIELTKLGYKVI